MRPVIVAPGPNFGLLQPPHFYTLYTDIHILDDYDWSISLYMIHMGRLSEKERCA